MHIVTFFSRVTKILGLTGTIGSIFILLTANTNAIPLNDAYETGQAEFQGSPAFQPRSEGQLVFHPSLHPGSNDALNEEHPIPDYVKKISKNKLFSTHYRQLLETEPVNQIQSKIFDEQAFRSIQKIGVLDFENRTVSPFRDEKAGHVIAKQISKELQSRKDYFIIPPRMTNEDARIRIVAQIPGNKAGQVEPPHVERQPAIPGLPNQNNKVDAVMIGAVSKYMNSYQDRNGKIEKSLSSKVEFGSFLVSTRTGNVLWGARFIGAQPTGLLSSGAKWLSKKQLSKRAMKEVLKSFRGNVNSSK